MNRFWKIFAIVLLILNALNFPLHIYSLYDRAEIHRENDKLRQMLDTRATIQIAVLNTVWPQLRPEQQKFIKDHWNEAEYDQALEVTPPK